jgi:hypothetical protein
LTFTKQGENLLSEWMAENALVAWKMTEEPWLEEKELIRTISLPLNLEGNPAHPFYAQLSRIRALAREAARAKSIVIPA